MLRYTVLIANRDSGVVRRFTISLRAAVAVGSLVVGLPVLVGMGGALKAKSELAQLYASHEALAIENASYKANAEEIAAQIQGLQASLDDLGGKAALDPSLSSAMDKLPSIVKSRALGAEMPRHVAAIGPGFSSPEDTFGMVRDLLSGLESGLQSMRGDVDRRNRLAAATPSIWPTRGWLSSAMGTRVDPFTEEPKSHEGLDISADKGTPVYATADATVRQAGFSGAYGNLVVLDHGFGLETRYGHLSQFAVHAGDTVKRGDLVGNVGATGRATGPHLHYEVRVNGRLLNPLQLLLAPKRAAD
jgi:murein DD-endopeptidase MepM/ murein hydrolase activator NlpD